MKKILLLFLIGFSFACSNKPNTEKVIILTIKFDELNTVPIGNKLTVTLKNNSNTTVSVWVMWNHDKSFIIDNKNIILPELEYKNTLPKQYLLKPLEEKNFSLFVLKNIDVPLQKFRIGFLSINDVSKDYSTAEKYQKAISDKKNFKIIWSNQLSL